MECGVVLVSDTAGGLPSVPTGVKTPQAHVVHIVQ